MEYISYISEVPDDSKQAIAGLYSFIFGKDRRAEIDKRLIKYPHYYLQCVFFKERLIAFKLAYEKRGSKGIYLYSWIGGVDPAFRRQGIASRLMQDQHQWAYARGYKRIVTRSTNEYANMMRLNLKAGYKITGITGGSSHTKQIVFVKTWP